jgi:hypothetical protein
VHHIESVLVTPAVAGGWPELPYLMAKILDGQYEIPTLRNDTISRAAQKKAAKQNQAAYKAGVSHLSLLTEYRIRPEDRTSMEKISPCRGF